jgi:hypothetical protein
MSILEPLLSLTVSATLRDKPLEMTAARRVLAQLIQTAGGLPSVIGDPKTPIEGGENEEPSTGLEEVNLLGALAAGMPFYRFLLDIIS